MSSVVFQLAGRSLSPGKSEFLHRRQRCDQSGGKPNLSFQPEKVSPRRKVDPFCWVCG